MKGNSILLLSMTFFCLSCEKDENIPHEYVEAEIIKATCGGTVVQVLSDKGIGQNWTITLQGQPETFHNIVLAGNVPLERQVEGDTLFFTYKTVEYFSGSNYCEIGGLPDVRI